MKLIVNNDWDSMSMSFYLEDDRCGKRVIIGQQCGLLTEYTIESYDVGTCRCIEPLLKMPSHTGERFIKAIVDYASEQQIKTVNENLLQGKLQATEKHLEDMRNGFVKILDKLIEK